ncbi:MAG: CDP-glucose 4,6-dehydratase [Chitinophagaceae bacterium]|nr:CDP-glucose 4,6-dehydratase [Chitinophagaceae bacterium]
MESVVNENFYTNYKNKKVFVTGHTGFKGSWLITWLTMLGAQVKGYALAPQNKKDIYNTVAKNIAIESVLADVRDSKRLKEELLAFEPDFIFHLAAQPLVLYGYKNPIETFEVNTMGTAHLLEAVRSLTKKCTVVLITTDKVYKNIEKDYASVEDDKLGGYDPYSASKAAAEIVIDCYKNSYFNSDQFSHHQKAIVSVRAGNVIGGGDFNVDRLVPDIVRALKNNETILLRNPDAVRPWQHVLEPLNGYLLLGVLANNDGLKYAGAYNFGPEIDDHLTVKELVEMAIKNWGSGNWKDISDANQPHEAGLLQLNINRAKNQLGWQPKLNSQQAIEWTIDWYKKSEQEIFDFSIKQISDYQAA